MSMMPAGGIRHIGWRLIHPSAYTRTGIKMRSGQHAASRQDDDTGEGCQELRPRGLLQRSGRPELSVCTTDLNRCAMCKVLLVVECPLLAYNNVLGGFEELYCIVDQGRQRNGGFSRERIRGVWKPLCPYKASLSF